MASKELVCPQAALSIRLPHAFVRARGKLSGREIGLDWRQLGRQKPRVWPGFLVLWSADEAAERNSYAASLLAPGERMQIHLIGTSTAGVLYAIDARGRIVVVDEIELDYPVVIADDFKTFEKAFVLSSEAQKQLAARNLRDDLRRLPAQWRKLDAVISGRHRLSSTANQYGMLVDIANLYLIAERRDALLEAIRAFVKRHPSKKALATKIRKYAVEFGGGHGRSEPE